MTLCAGDFGEVKIVICKPQKVKKSKRKAPKKRKPRKSKVKKESKTK